MFASGVNHTYLLISAYVHSSATSLGTLVHLVIKSITWQQLNAFKHVDMVNTVYCFKPSIRMGNEGDFSDSGMVVGASVGGLIFPH